MRRLLLSVSEPPVELDPDGRHATFSPQGNRFLMETGHGAVDLVDAATGERIRRLQQGITRLIPRHAYCGPEDSRHASSNDGRLVALERYRRPHSASFEEITRELQGRSLRLQSVEILDAENGRLVSTIASLREQIDFIGFTPEADAAWVLCNKHELRMVALGKPTWPSKGKRGVDQMAVSPDGATVSRGGRDPGGESADSSP